VHVSYTVCPEHPYIPVNYIFDFFYTSAWRFSVIVNRDTHSVQLIADVVSS